MALEEEEKILNCYFIPGFISTLFSAVVWKCNVYFTFIFSDNAKELRLPPAGDEESKRALAMFPEQEKEKEGLHFMNNEPGELLKNLR